MVSAESSSERLLKGLECLLRVPTGNLQATLSRACDVMAGALHSDKVDAFLYDSTRDSLVAISSSHQPVAALQRKLGLDILPLSNGGRVIQVYTSGQTFHTGRLRDDPEELLGVREGLRIQSQIGVPLEIAGRRRGMVMVASLEPERYQAEDVRFAEVIVRWTGILAHRAELAEQMRRNAAEHGRRSAAEELIATVAHDMRNYLAPIELRLQILRALAARAHTSEELLGEIERISRSEGRLRTLVADLLDVTRLDHGLLEVHSELIDLAGLVRESAGALSRPDISVDVSVQSTGEVFVPADPTRLRQCVDNLIANAIEYSPQGGTVTILIDTRTLECAEQARVTVSDEGPGVPPEVLPRIFERHVTGRPRGGGLGLGLFIAKRIAELHGGDVSVDSSPGRGARFTLCLPCQLRGRADPERRP